MAVTGGPHPHWLSARSIRHLPGSHNAFATTCLAAPPGRDAVTHATPSRETGPIRLRQRGAHWRRSLDAVTWPTHPLNAWGWGPPEPPLRADDSCGA